MSLATEQWGCYPDSMDRKTVAEIAALLERIAMDRSLLEDVPAEDRERFLKAVANVYHPDRVERRRMAKVVDKRRKAARVRRDDGVLHETGIRALRRKPVFTTPNYSLPGRRSQLPTPTPKSQNPTQGSRIPELQHCYVCKQKYTRDSSLLRSALSRVRGAELPQAHRAGRSHGARRAADRRTRQDRLPGRAEAAALRRAPDRDHALPARRGGALRREPDFDEWGDRLEIFGLDLRHTPSVEAFCRELLATRRAPRLHHQQRVPDRAAAACFYAHMMEGETPRCAMPEHVRGCWAVRGLRGYHLLPKVRRHAASMTTRHVAGSRTRRSCRRWRCCLRSCPARWISSREGQLDQDLQQVDLRGRNSWRLLLHEVSSVELLEVQLVNAVAPFIINARLKPLMLRTPGARQAHRQRVGGGGAVLPQLQDHPASAHEHGEGGAQHDDAHRRRPTTTDDGIHMNSVDTGWVTDEDPAEIAARKTAEQRFHPPLDIVDGAARIVDPIISGFNTGDARLGTVPEGLRADGLVKRVEEDFGCLRAGSPVAFVEYEERHAGGADVTREIDVGLDGFRVPVVAQRRCGFVAIETCIGRELGELFRSKTDRSSVK